MTFDLPFVFFFIRSPFSSLHGLALNRFLGPFPMTPPLQTELRKYAKTKTMCICKYIHISVVEQEQDKQDLNLREQGLLWGCLVLAMQQLTCAAPPSNALSSVRVWGCKIGVAPMPSKHSLWENLVCYLLTSGTK